MVSPTFAEVDSITKITVGWSIGFALILFISALLPVAAQPSDSLIRIALIDDFSGLGRERGDQVRVLFENYVKATNEKGGLTVGSRTYKIELIRYDTGSSSAAAAHELMSRAAEVDRAIVAVCRSFGCAQVANETNTPLILTASSMILPQRASNTFLIRAPSQQDFAKQTSLAIETLHKALITASEPTREKVTVALRSLKFVSELGEVRFDESGNNIGQVTYPFRPDGAGCTNSCGSTCPSNCGGTSCTKSGPNQCCSICGMPRPN